MRVVQSGAQFFREGEFAGRRKILDFIIDESRFVVYKDKRRFLSHLLIGNNWDVKLLRETEESMSKSLLGAIWDMRRLLSFQLQQQSK